MRLIQTSGFMFTASNTWQHSSNFW